MKKTHSYHPQVYEAAKVLGLEVARARRERRRTAVDLAERAGISPVTLRKIERGDPSVAMGTVFEVASLLGIPLLSPDRTSLAQLADQTSARLTLLPARVRARRLEVHDDF
ncbi:MAG: helix-turn-helix transcriptional regulator [Acidimicrobiales bacterium]